MGTVYQYATYHILLGRKSLNGWLVAIFLLLASIPAFSQVILVDKAYEFAKKKDFQKAREILDLASGNEPTTHDPRTWYLKGYVYKELYKADPELGIALRERALEFLQKSQQLDTKGIYQKDCQAAAHYLHLTYFNEAIQAYNRQKYNEALAGFSKYLQYSATQPPDDTYAEALYYAGYASGVVGKKEDALRYYEKGLALNYQNPLLYSDLSALYEEMGKGSNALQVITTGRQQFPNDTILRVAEINVLLSQSNFIKAEKLVEEYLALDANNLEVMMVAGTVYEKIAQSDSLSREKYFNKRKEIYRRALVLNPNSFSANYNMGITIYNRAVDIIKSQRYDLEIVELYTLLEQVSGLFQEAKPFVEKAYNLSPQNMNAMRALEGIYYNLNEKDKSSQIRAKINGMK
jgi:tetratricopeptide (TPR) repeat protein